MSRSRASRAALTAAVLGVTGLMSSGAWAASYTWTPTTGGNWSDNSWGGGYPNAAGDSATINTNIGAASTMTIDVTDAKVGSLTFGDSSGPQTWAIGAVGGTNALTLQTSSGNASITLTGGGANTINAPIVLASSADIANNTATNAGFALNGAISGTGNLNLSTGTNSNFITMTIGSGIGDTAANTYNGSVTWTTPSNGGVTTSASNLQLNKAAGTNAITGDLTVRGYVIWKQSNQIADASNLTLDSNGIITMSNVNETVNSVHITGGAYTGTGGNGSTFIATDHTTIDSGSWTLVSRGGAWTTGTMTINGGTNTIDATNANAGDTLTINTGMVINQPGSGAFTALSLQNSSTKLALVNLLGDLTFNGDSGNNNSTTIAASYSGTGVASQNVIRLGNAPGTNTRTFTVGDGGAGIDLIVQPVIQNGTGTGAIIKAGAGTLQLDGVNTYTGGTAVNAGRLLAHNTSGSATGTAAVTVQTGGILGGDGFIGGAVSTVSSGTGAAANGHIQPGLDGVGTLTVNNTVNLGNNSFLAYDLGTPNVAAGTGGNDLLSVLGISGSNGDLTIGTGLTLAVTQGTGFGNGTYHLIGYSGSLADNSSSFSGWTVTGLQAGQSANFVLGTASIDLVVVPEPTTGALLALSSLLMMGFAGRRRRKAA